MITSFGTVFASPVIMLDVDVLRAARAMPPALVGLFVVRTE